MVQLLGLRPLNDLSPWHRLLWMLGMLPLGDALVNEVAHLLEEVQLQLLLWTQLGVLRWLLAT
jgi:hypothetical protein